MTYVKQSVNLGMRRGAQGVVRTRLCAPGKVVRSRLISPSLQVGTIRSGEEMSDAEYVAAWCLEMAHSDAWADDAFWLVCFTGAPPS